MILSHWSHAVLQDRMQTRRMATELDREQALELRVAVLLDDEIRPCARGTPPPRRRTGSRVSGSSRARMPFGASGRAPRAPLVQPPSATMPTSQPWPRVGRRASGRAPWRCATSSRADRRLAGTRPSLPCRRRACCDPSRARSTRPSDARRQRSNGFRRLRRRHSDENFLMPRAARRSSTLPRSGR